jgi:hypothetical protein
VVEHFYRTFTRKSTKDTVAYPSYLVNSKPPVFGELETNMEMLKSGEYDLSQEENLLSKLGTLIGISNDKVNKIISKELGLIPLMKKRDERLAAEEVQERMARVVAMTIDAQYGKPKKNQTYSQHVKDKYK